MSKKNKRKGVVLAVQDEPELRYNPSFSVSDPALAEYLGLSGVGYSPVSEETALGLTAYWRCINIVAGTIAGLPLKTYRETNDKRERVRSFLDTPAGPYKLTPFAWKELVMFHLLTRGETFLVHIKNGAGAVIGLWPIHPSAVDVEYRGYDKWFEVSLTDGTKRTYGPDDMTHIMALTTDGVRGVAPLTVFRRTIQLGINGEVAASRSFSNGMLIAGIATPETDMTEDDAKIIKAGLNAKMTGVENAGDIAVVNRSLKFTPWAMTNADAEFLASREFQVVEFARMFGVPPHLLGATEKQTSWGTGVAEQNLGLSRFTLMSWTGRIEEALSQLLPNPRFCEFDYSGLLQGSPKEEIQLLIEQVEAGLLTVDEARAIRNLPPLTEAQKAEQKPAVPAVVESSEGEDEDE